jgi:hypothetical protein
MGIDASLYRNCNSLDNCRIAALPQNKGNYRENVASRWMLPSAKKKELPGEHMVGPNCLRL